MTAAGENEPPDAGENESPIRMDSQSLVELYIPQVSEKMIPRVGQIFSSSEEAYVFYNAYAKAAGFSIRIDSGKKKQNTPIWIWRNFVCNKEGMTNQCNENKRKDPLKNHVRQRGTTRCGCKAQLNILKNKDDSSYHVSLFDEGHNDALATPRKVHLLNSQRKVSQVAKSLVDEFELANIPLSQQVRVMAKQAGGIQNMGFTRADLKNYLRDKKEERRGHDAMMLKEYFEFENAKNSSFYFEFDKDEEDRMTRCFWVDAVARRAYNYFGDVVVFDTTYQTNEFCLIFAPLTGVNHHGQTIIFGSAFLSDEKTESFVWVLQQWLKVLPNGPPKVIITDQDPAMAKAIAQVLPHTVHRYCIWHIMMKLPDKIGLIISKDYYSYFKNSVYYSETVEEFEASWKEAVQKSKTEDNTWLHTMYEIRDRWVPAYARNIFSAGMTSSQRAESNHSFFKKYVDSKNSLMLFITRFNIALDHQRHEELVADYIDINETPKLKTKLPMEEQMRDVYTRKIFLKFQEQVFESDAYFAKLINETEEQCTYTVKRISLGSSKVRELEYDKNSNFAKCSCRHFEFEGISCRHLVAFLKVRGEFYLPSQYIMSRWTKNAKSGRVFDKDGVEVKEVGDKSLIMRRTNLSQVWSSVVDEASQSEEGTEYLLNTMKTAMDHIKGLHVSTSIGIVSVPSNELVLVINEPLPVSAKGSGKRLKSSKEKAIGIPRLCRSCGQRGTNHDSRNCPKLQDP